MLRRRTKLARVLQHLAIVGSLNRFEAEKIGDHTLPQTVLKLHTTHGLTVARQEEVVHGYGGNATICTRYWLEAEAREQALKLLAFDE